MMCLYQIGQREEIKRRRLEDYINFREREEQRRRNVCPEARQRLQGGKRLQGCFVTSFLLKILFLKPHLTSPGSFTRERILWLKENKNTIKIRKTRGMTEFAAGVCKFVGRSMSCEIKTGKSRFYNRIVNWLHTANSPQSFSNPFIEILEFF